MEAYKPSINPAGTREKDGDTDMACIPSSTQNVSRRIPIPPDYTVSEFNDHHSGTRHSSPSAPPKRGNPSVILTWRTYNNSTCSPKLTCHPTVAITASISSRPFPLLNPERRLPSRGTYVTR
ncbi:hypothetical protein B7494_g7962 [Chlorociboria aeruginascens]|nr:hypothetical protein B7494_g7962 [Chlorociboria aeruginascens]